MKKWNTEKLEAGENKALSSKPFFYLFNLYTDTQTFLKESLVPLHAANYSVSMGYPIQFVS